MKKSKKKTKEKVEYMKSREDGGGVTTGDLGRITESTRPGRR